MRIGDILISKAVLGFKEHILLVIEPPQSNGDMRIEVIPLSFELNTNILKYRITWDALTLNYEQIT